MDIEIDPDVLSLVALLREEMHAEHAALEAGPEDSLGRKLRAHTREVHARRRQLMMNLSLRLRQMPSTWDDDLEISIEEEHTPPDGRYVDISELYYSDRGKRR